jgi:DNA (cytosine-5)-methyltransferase 1
LYEIVTEPDTPTEAENIVLDLIKRGVCVNVMKWDKSLKKLKVNPVSILELLEENKYIKVSEIRYEFKNSKISTGINGINRVILRSSNIFPTLVASDTNDYVATVDLNINDKEHFINEIYKPGNYRKVSKEEACLIQGYPKDFILPENRQRWMKLIGNSVTVPVIEKLVKSIVDTGVFKE